METLFEKSFVITGTARSGTAWVAGILQELGLDAKYQHTFGQDKLHDWNALLQAGAHNIEPIKKFSTHGEVSWAAAAYIPLLDPAVPVVHLVRDPLKVVRSMYGQFLSPAADQGMYTALMLDHLGSTISLMQEEDYCMHYWWKWNHLIEDRSFLRMPLEDLNDGTDSWVELLDRLGEHKSINQITDALHAGVPHNLGLPKARDYVWTDFSIPWLNEIIAMAQRYGYA